jgi:2-haloacid dehalogenase
LPDVIMFDVIETLLNLHALDPHFLTVFGDAAARQEWFAQMLQSALVSTVTNAYSDFSAIGAAALQMTAQRRGIQIPYEEDAQLLANVKNLPPHPEVQESLQRLRDAGLRLAALTNSTQQVAETQMQNAGLAEYFELILSADSVRRLKPAPEPYQMAASRLGTEIQNVRMVAAHSWDVAGALRAGCAAAFVARPGKVLDPLATKPDIVGVDLREVADQILQVEKNI